MTRTELLEPCMSKTLTTREAYAALAAGKKVRRSDADFRPIAMNNNGRLHFVDEPADEVRSLCPGAQYEVVEDPLTDEQLIAEWLATASDKHCPFAFGYALRKCARQLRERRL